MKKHLRIVTTSVLMVFLVAGSALALGMNITIYDNRGYHGNARGGEDQETEPGMINNQSWDLEGFFLEGTTLTMIGGWDFVTGNTPSYPYESGDIFIDVDGDAEYGITSSPTLSTYGYDYVLDLDFSTNPTYDVYALSPSSSVLTPVVESYNCPESNPWRYCNGGDPLGGYQNVSFIYTDFGTLTDSETGFSGGNHNAVAVDLGFLGHHQEFTAHFTIGCGNDNLMGNGTTPAPEPATLLLMGSGLIGLGCIGRRKFKKN